MLQVSDRRRSLVWIIQWDHLRRTTASSAMLYWKLNALPERTPVLDRNHGRHGEVKLLAKN